MQIKAIVRYHFTPIRMTIIKKIDMGILRCSSGYNSLLSLPLAQGLIPSQGTNVPQATWRGQKLKKKKIDNKCPPNTEHLNT